MTTQQVRRPGQHAHGNAAAPNLLVFTEHFNATYSISFELPLKHLHARGQVNFSAYSQAEVDAAGGRRWKSWIRACAPRTVILSRVGRPAGVQILRYCRARGIPVVYHIDDDLLDLPASLGAEVLKRHMAPEVVEARRTLLAECDLIYASTGELARILRERFPAQQVFHGIYAPYLDTRAASAHAGDATTIGYMGSQGHKEDLALAVPALVRLMREQPQLRFETFGTIEMPAELAAFGERVRHHTAHKGYAEFLAKLGTLRWQVGLAPLVDEPFNRCKAPTKFIEYTGAGIPTVASPVVYADAAPAGCIVLAGDAWYQALGACLDDARAREGRLEAARVYCSEAYGLDRLARQVMHVATERVAGRAPGGFSGWVSRWTERVARRGAQSVERGGDPRRAAVRILYVANSFLPTLQLCFVRPLAPLAAAGELAWELVADIQLSRAAKLLPGLGARWVRDRLETFRPDLIVFCRYSGAHAAQVQQWARERKVPTILHLDDDLLDVPPEIGADKHAFHNQPRRLAAVRHLLSHADVVYCSTPVLLERMKRHGLDGAGIAARVHCAGEVLREAPQGGEFRIGYMGIGHAQDFELAVPALVRVLQRHPHVRFELFGPIAKPQALEPFGDRVTTVDFVGSYDEFLRRLAERGWAVGICPLADTPFNRTKGNNKWVEYTSAGAAVVASAGTVYDDCCAAGCGLLAAGDADWEQALQALVDNTQLRLATVAAAQRRLAAEYAPEAVRGQLLEVFRLAQARAHGRSSAPAGAVRFFQETSASAPGAKEA